ncbi:hypothetical protein K438DRAFT_47069 [Mycena galopus ATCC 62051]|nr:hypothetical protein K438DRAFT_47069 [Mycena galopus ATCC 62051]
MARNTLRMSVRDDPPPLYVNIPHIHDTLAPPILKEKEPGPRIIRPLPRPPPPLLDSDPARGNALRRRASGGSFIHLPPPPKKKPTLHVCNPSDSPISPATPKLPHSAPYPYSLRSPPINVIPPTPLTPRLVHSPATALSPSTLLTPTTFSSRESIPDSMPPSPKHRRRFGIGRSVGSIPESVLADLRSAPERRGPTRANTLPLPLGLGRFAQSDSDSSGEDEDDEEDSDSTYTFILETAIATRLSSVNRSPVERDEGLGGDKWVRWVASHNSAILRAL